MYSTMRLLWYAVPGESVGLDDVNPSASEVTNVIISNLGGSGTYQEVISMQPGEGLSCIDEDAACVQEVSSLVDIVYHLFALSPPPPTRPYISEDSERPLRGTWRK